MEQQAQVKNLPPDQAGGGEEHHSIDQTRSVDPPPSAAPPAQPAQQEQPPDDAIAIASNQPVPPPSHQPVLYPRPSTHKSAFQQAFHGANYSVQHSSFTSSYHRDYSFHSAQAAAPRPVPTSQPGDEPSDSESSEEGEEKGTNPTLKGEGGISKSQQFVEENLMEREEGEIPDWGSDRRTSYDSTVSSSSGATNPGPSRNSFSGGGGNFSRQQPLAPPTYPEYQPWSMSSAYSFHAPPSTSFYPRYPAASPFPSDHLPLIARRGPLPPLPTPPAPGGAVRQPTEVPAPPPVRSVPYGVQGSQFEAGQFRAPEAMASAPASTSSAPAQPGRGKRMEKPANAYEIPNIPGMKPFVTKLRYMMMHPQNFGEIICWSHDAETVLVDFSNPLLASDVLPRVYTHGNPNGFKTQFTNYGFVQLKDQALELALNAPPADVNVTSQPVASTSHQPLTTSTSTEEEQSEESDEEEEDEEEEEKVIIRSSKDWRAFQHRHTREDFLVALQQELEASGQVQGQGQGQGKKKKGIRRATATEEEEQDQLEVEVTGPEQAQGQGDDEENEEEEEEEEEEEDGNWFCAETMNDLKVLRRLKPSGSKSGGGGGAKQKTTRPAAGDDEGGGGSAQKKSKKAIETIQSITGAPASSSSSSATGAGVGTSVGAGTRMVGGVEVPKLLR
ncbi:uncharacterized protein JCM6883_002526 [Sporobolomyces salmoneus]|uniref:uncharacterized protein n=1 Tax=Sporobolomyces salmoneus TaxID=183962 RepID=UPI00317A73F8